MRTIIMMFDSLNRLMLSPYGCDWTITPNFKRLAERSVTFDNNYAGSLPCMPARRELHTGRINFLHRSWGPMEPFDHSVFEILSDHGVYSHLITDHVHYFEDGGATYHTRYNSWEFYRGQEGDSWKVTPESFEPMVAFQNDDAKYFQGTRRLHLHDKINRQFTSTETTMPLTKTMDAGLEFIDLNHEMDKFILQIECFDPHEPFFCMDKYRNLYPHEYPGRDCDWPPYHHVTEDPDTVKHLRYEYAALLTMCDVQLGRLLNSMDKYNMWKDTMLIVCTDHGYLLGEHGWWAKTIQPLYDEICHTPLFIWDPRYGVANERRTALTQFIDIPATLMEFFGVECPNGMEGKSLSGVICNDTKIRDTAMFGYYGAHVCITDGRYVYMRAPINERNQPISEYTLMPTHMRSRFSTEELKNAKLDSSFSFTRGIPILRIPKEKGVDADYFGDCLYEESNAAKAKTLDNNALVNAADFGNKLFDLKNDPREEVELHEPELELRMANLLRSAMLENESPLEQFERIGLPCDHEVRSKDIQPPDMLVTTDMLPPEISKRKWERSGLNAFRAILRFLPNKDREQRIRQFIEYLAGYSKDTVMDGEQVLRAIKVIIPAEYQTMVYYFCSLSSRVH